jgi:hypothetical protein
MRRQKGVTLTGMILVSIIAILLLLLAFKIVPVYTEYFAIERNLRSMASDPKLRSPSRAAVAGAWALRASVDDLPSMSGDQIEITREGDQIVFSGEYSVKVPLFRNVAACFDFKPTSKE